MLCMYRGHPNITQTYSRVFKHMEVSKHKGHPNMQRHPNVWGHGHSLGVTKHVFFVLCMYGGIQTLSKHTGGVHTYGGIQTYRGPCKHKGHQNMQGYPNVWGIWTPLKCDKACFLCVVYVQGASKHLSNI